MDAARQRLADAMEARRLELRLHWKEVAQRTGMSEANLFRIRNGSVDPRPISIAGIERALEWAKGSVEAILDGGEPTLLSESPDAATGTDKTPQPAPEQRDSTLPVAVRQAIESRATYATEQIEFPELELIVIAKVGEYEDIETLRRQAAEWAKIQRAIRDAQRRTDTPSEPQPPHQGQ